MIFSASPQRIPDEALPDRVQLWIKGGEEGMNDEPFTEVSLFD